MFTDPLKSTNVANMDMEDKNLMPLTENKISPEDLVEFKAYQERKNRPKIKRKIPLFWTDEEVKRMLTLTHNRDYIIIGILYFFALRINELIHMTVSDIDFKSMKIVVFGKGGRRGEIPMLRDGYMFWIDLKRWVEGRPLDSYVIPGRREDGTMSKRSMHRIVKRYAGLAKVSFYEKAHPHTLRHSRATFLEGVTNDLRLVQRFLRHSWISTTEIYSHASISAANLRKEMDRRMKL